MIDYVHRGQQLNSGLLNGIIKQANGQTKPTDGLFRNTTQGSLFINDEKLKQQPYNYNQFLDIRTTPRMLSGEMYPYYDVYLGMELSSSLNEFPITYSDPTGRSQYLSRIPYIGSWIL